MEPRPAASAPPVTLVAAGTFDTIQVGTPLTTPDMVTRAFQAALETSKGYRGPRVKIPVLRASAELPEDRQLDGDVRRNYRKIHAVTSAQALTASGGVCVPPNVRYDLPILGDQGRPVRDGAMVRFGADRGGIKTLVPPTLPDTEDAITVWTMANDANPSDPATKACMSVSCPEDSDGVVEALVKCLEFGNFRQRFFPEQFAAFMDLTAVQHARTAETRLLTAIGTGSTQVTTGEMLGVTRDLLAMLDRGIAAMKSRHRVRDLSIRWVAPFWLKDMIRSDVARQMPVGTMDETLVLADAAIERWFTGRGVNVTWTLDGESGQVFGAQADGGMNPWPSTVVSYLYPEGSWLFLDGGQLDLGIVRDSTLNSTNDFQVFAETIEGAHFHGVESLRITSDVCPSGAAGALVESDPCTIGS